MPVAPTYSNYLRLKEELKIAEEGYNLLDEKREVLIMELMHNIHGYKDLEEKVTDRLNEAYRVLEDAFTFLGKGALKVLSKESKEPTLSIRMRSIMGIPVPELLVDIPEEDIMVSLDSTDESFDKALLQFKELIKILTQWAAKEALLWILGQEVNKTQKRVNALNNIFIPEYKREIKHIEENLEEEDREEFFRRKRLKRRGH
jgi:V/A-type H+-transporting ATPase subunit D